MRMIVNSHMINWEM